MNIFFTFSFDVLQLIMSTQFTLNSKENIEHWKKPWNQYVATITGNFTNLNKIWSKKKI